MINRSNALLSRLIATSGSSFEIFFTLEGLGKVAGFIVALVHPIVVFSRHSEMGISDQRICADICPANSLPSASNACAICIV
jgi:hypothetical protein